MTAPRLSEEDLIQALQSGESVIAIAKRCELNERTLRRRIKSLAKRGYSPDHGLTTPYPDGFKMGKVTIQRNSGGEIERTWERMCEDSERQQALMVASMDAALKDLPQIAPRKSSGKYLDNLLTVYPVGDPHFGEYIWGDECGKDWDLSIAERTHCEVMAALVESAPTTERAVLINLGDAAHYDSMVAMTPRSGHPLDADSRYAKMVDVLILAMRQMVESALAKHKYVHIVHVIGNHDETGAVWLSRLFAHLYAQEPRVTVETSPSVFSYYRWGANLIGMHHGHTCKAEKLGGVMAADRARDWGETLHRYWYTGHIHHESKKEFPGVVVESFNTLAPGDSYATAGGWRSRQNMKCIVLHKDFGEVARHTVHPDMLKGND